MPPGEGRVHVRAVEESGSDQLELQGSSLGMEGVGEVAVVASEEEVERR